MYHWHTCTDDLEELWLTDANDLQVSMTNMYWRLTWTIDLQVSMTHKYDDFHVPMTYMC